MCEPISLITGGLAIASAVGNHVTQTKAAKAQQRAINTEHARVAEENRDAASAEMFDQMRASRREQAKIRTAGSEAGLAGNSGSIEGLLFDSAMQMELQGSRTLANLESRQAANDAQGESLMSQVQKPTLLNAGLQVAGAATSAYAGYKNRNLAIERAGDL